MKTPKSDIMISVCCITYNHEQYIREAIEGFLMQKTNFKYEILFGEDCSTDKTRQIIEEYARIYSHIKIITSKTNVGPNSNAKRVIANAAGKYIALCDGDDYWTDSLKLQKQFDFLESNPDYIICCHYCKEIDSSGQELYVNENPVSLHYSYNDLMVNKQAETSTASLLIRNSEEFKELFSKSWFSACNAADKFIKLYATSKTGKKIYVMPEVMSCYRRHTGGIWSMTPTEVLRQKQLNDFHLIINHFDHDFFQKFRLFIFYIRRYLRYQIRNTKVTDAFQTIRSIFYPYLLSK